MRSLLLPLLILGSVITFARAENHGMPSVVTMMQRTTETVTVAASQGALEASSAPLVGTSTTSGVPVSTASPRPSTASVGSESLIPNGVKAGVAGYRSITDKSSWTQFTPHIGWYSDYWPDTPDSGSVTGVGMVSLCCMWIHSHLAEFHCYSYGVMGIKAATMPVVLPLSRALPKRQSI